MIHDFIDYIFAAGMIIILLAFIPIIVFAYLEMYKEIKKGLKK